MRAYHGTTTAVVSNSEYRLLPPVDSGEVQEEGRKKRLDCVFATPDIGLAKVYAGRAARRFGGEPIILEVILPDRDTEVDPGSRDGATVLVAPGGWISSRQLKNENRTA